MGGNGDVHELVGACVSCGTLTKLFYLQNCENRVRWVVLTNFAVLVKTESPEILIERVL